MNTSINRERAISVKEFFAGEPKDIIIPESSEILISPNSDKHESLYHFVSVKSIDDLKDLSLIPFEINSDKLKQAIQSDDEEAVKIAKSNFKYDLSECDCHDKKRNTLKSVFTGIRKQSHFELTNLLTNYYNQKMHWDSMEVKHTYKWISLVTDSVRSHVLSVLLTNDVIINRNSTMIIDTGTDLIRGRDLKIYSGGKMKIKSSYLFLKFVSAEGNILKDSIATIKEKPTFFKN
jgi:hypothetical protein